MAERDRGGALLEAARRFAELGFRIQATEGTRASWPEHGVEREPILKMHEGRPNIVDAIKNGEIQLVINTPVGKLERARRLLHPQGGHQAQGALHHHAGGRRGRGRGHRRPPGRGEHGALPAGVAGLGAMNTGRWLPLVDRFVAASFADDPGGLNLRHLRRTLHWLLELDPGADEAVQIAALAHDLQRAYRAGEPEGTGGFLDPVFLGHHQERGGAIIATFLRQQGAGEELAERVRMLVSRHEEGGTDEQNLLRDADSVSFFENNCDFFLRVLAPVEGPASVRAKFSWMFERIGSEPARRIARPWYEVALARINGLEINR